MIGVNSTLLVAFACRVMPSSNLSLNSTLHANMPQPRRRPAAPFCGVGEHEMGDAVHVIDIDEVQRAARTEKSGTLQLEWDPTDNGGSAPVSTAVAATAANGGSGAPKKQREKRPSFDPLEELKELQGDLANLKKERSGSIFNQSRRQTDLFFKDVSFEAGGKKILKSVTGYAQPGRMLGECCVCVCCVSACVRAGSLKRALCTGG
jgi:hypothetical protein